jgi:hypothetical protein
MAVRIARIVMQELTQMRERYLEDFAVGQMFGSGRS